MAGNTVRPPHQGCPCPSEGSQFSSGCCCGREGCRGGPAPAPAPGRAAVPRTWQRPPGSPHSPGHAEYVPISPPRRLSAQVRRVKVAVLKTAKALRVLANLNSNASRRPCAEGPTLVKPAGSASNSARHEQPGNPGWAALSLAGTASEIITRVQSWPAGRSLRCRRQLIRSGGYHRPPFKLTVK
jgi:hypothetical protein